MRLRILQVASGMDRLSGGTERYILDISRGLAARGHEVTIAASPCFQYPEYGHRASLRMASFHASRSFGWKQMPRLVGHLAVRYDVVHTHFPCDYVIPAVAARIARVAAVVMTRHLPQPFASRKKAYLCTSLVYDRVIAVSGSVRTMLIESGARPDRIEVVYNGLRPSAPDRTAALRLRCELEIPADAILIAAAGRIEAEKGFEVLLRAVQRLACSGVKVHCAIFGSGRLLQDLRTLAHELRIGDCVRLPGFRTDVRHLWAAADIAVVPSTWQEPFGYAAIEALSAGCPVIASRVGGLSEILSGDAGILVEAGDVHSLASAIKNLISSPELRREMQQAAVARASLFTLEKTVSSVERVYIKAISEKRNLPSGLRPDRLTT